MVSEIPYPILKSCELVILAASNILIPRKTEEEEKIWNAICQPPPERWRDQDD